LSEPGHTAAAGAASEAASAPGPSRADSREDLEIAGRRFRSRLILGTGGFSSHEALADAIEASGAEIVTVALRRVDPAARGSLIDVLDEAGVMLLPNTAGCLTAHDAVVTARLAREAFSTGWIKLEVIGDDRTLLPDAPALLEAAEELIGDGFVVLPYTTDDPVLGMNRRQRGTQDRQVRSFLTVPREIPDHVFDQPDDAAHVTEFMTVQYAAFAGPLENVPQIGKRERGKRVRPRLQA